MNEYYVTLTRKLDPGLTPDDAWDDVQALLAWEPQPADPDLLLLARGIERRYRLSWWDAMIVAAAQVQNCPLLLTEDLQNGLVCGGVTIRDPFDTHVAEPTATARYEPEPVPVSRHRRPGRPRTRR